MYTSIDGGLNFAQNTLSFPFDGELVFNPFNEDYLIALNAKKVNIKRLATNLVSLIVNTTEVMLNCAIPVSYIVLMYM
jgi:hypothetical protein